MTPAEKASVTERLLSIVEKEFHADLSEALSITVMLTEHIPDQVNNEVRNALTHLARAYCTDDHIVATTNLKKAADHIERGKRDCLKLSIIHLHDSIRSTTFQIEQTYGLALTLDLRRSIRALRDRRAAIYKGEASGDSGTGDKLAELLKSYIDLEEHITSNFTLPNRKINWVYRLGYRAWSWFCEHLKQIAYGLIITVVTFLANWVLFPNGIEEDFPEYLKFFGMS